MSRLGFRSRHLEDSKCHRLTVIVTVGACGLGIQSAVRRSQVAHLGRLQGWYSGCFNLRCYPHQVCLGISIESLPSS